MLPVELEKRVLESKTMIQLQHFGFLMCLIS